MNNYQRLIADQMRRARLWAPPKPVVQKLEGEIAQTIVAEVAPMQNPFITEKTLSNPMDRLKEKLAKAASAGSRLAAKIEAKADALIAREGELEDKTDKAFAVHEQIMDAAGAQLDEVENALNQLTNGGPALDK
jgi:hypothetical protein